MKFTQTLVRLALSAAICTVPPHRIRASHPCRNPAAPALRLCSQALAPSPISRAAKIWASPPAPTSPFSPSASSARPLRFAAPIPSTRATSAARKTSSSAPKSSTPWGRFHPYADFLIGRGEIDYHQRRFHLRRHPSTSAPTPSSTPPASVSTTTSPTTSQSRPTCSFSIGTPRQLPLASSTLRP